jgi:biotin carboxylase
MHSHRAKKEMEYRFERIAIINRGEAAIRLMRAIRELNGEQHLNLSTVALFTEPDRQTIFVREADDALCIGPATFVDHRDGQRKSSYLDLERIEQALMMVQVDAAWFGRGILTEESWFAGLCKRLGIVFIGPNAEAMRLLDNKISAKQLAQQANIPVVPWSGRPIVTEAEAWQFAEHLGYPLMIKPAVVS